jgi:hypothetical protein
MNSTRKYHKSRSLSIGPLDRIGVNLKKLHLCRISPELAVNVPKYLKRIKAAATYALVNCEATPVELPRQGVARGER